MPFFSLLRKNALVRRSCISKASVTSHNHSDRQRQAGSCNVCIHPAKRDTPLTELYVLCNRVYYEGTDMVFMH